MKNENKVLLILIAILAVFIIGMILSPKSMGQSKGFTSLEYHQKLQKEYSYETWKKNQPKKKIEAVKYSVWASNENYKESKANQKLNKRIERIRQRIK